MSLTTGRNRDTTAGDGRVTRRRRHPVAAFFLLTFAISWGYWAVALGLLGQDSLWWVAPGVFGPAVAAVVLTAYLAGREGLGRLGRQMLLWRVGLRWYAVGLAGLPVLVGLSFAFLPGGTDRFAEEGWVVVPVYLATAVVITLVGGGQEEPGWRGFALPRMQERWGPLPAALLLGTLWGLWHLPLFVFVPDYNHSGHGFIDVALMYALFVPAYTVGLSVVLAWLFNNARGSLLFLMLVHGFTNAAWGLGPETRAQSATFYVMWGLLGATVALGTRGRLGLDPPNR